MPGREHKPQHHSNTKPGPGYLIQVLGGTHWSFDRRSTDAKKSNKVKDEISRSFPNSFLLLYTSKRSNMLHISCKRLHTVAQLVLRVTGKPS